MQSLTFIFTFLLFRSKFERQGGFAGICLGFLVMGLVFLVIIGWGMYVNSKKPKK